VEDTNNLICRATSANLVLAQRHEAFGEIVARFQDIVFGCAYAVLGDFYLAQDAAQEAFITAWKKLDQLQNPDAFPGWLRRVVLTECNRMTRGKRLKFLPLETGAEIASNDADPAAMAERMELRERVLGEIKALPENERMVTTLFYIDGYSQNDICEFLEVPATTVAKRLYSARQRLKKRMIEMYEDDLKEHRPSKDASFADAIKAGLRPFAEQDWEPIVNIAYALEPNNRSGNDLWLRKRQSFDESVYKRRHYIAEHADTGQILGYGSIEQSIFLPNYRIFLLAEPKMLRGGVGDLLLERLMKDLLELNAITVWMRDYDTQAEQLAFFKERGFEEIIKVRHLTLSLSDANPPSLLPAARETAQRGITITTIAQERENDQDCLYKLIELLNILKADDPHCQPFISVPFDVVGSWFEKPSVLPDAAFIAKDSDRYIGFSNLILDDMSQGEVSFGFTGVRREYRRQGVATALKLRAIDYAREHGYGMVNTWNHASQSSITALNEKLGFQQRFVYITVEKFLKEIARVDPAIYDSYAGEYEVDGDDLLKLGVKPDFNFKPVITRVGDRLISQCRDQRNELFPTSETRFFFKEFYGEVEFFKDEQGEVSHVIYREQGLAIRARKKSDKQEDL
jgi:RNA polymerase sigma factor (sigma-70 family)